MSKTNNTIALIKSNELKEPYDKYDIDKYCIYVASLFQHEKFLFHCANNKFEFPQTALYVNMVMQNVKMCILCLESGCKIDKFCVMMSFGSQNVELVELCHKHNYAFDDDDIAKITVFDEYYKMPLQCSEKLNFHELHLSYLNEKTFSNKFELSLLELKLKSCNDHNSDSESNDSYNKLINYYLDKNRFNTNNNKIKEVVSFCMNKIELSEKQFESLKLCYSDEYDTIKIFKKQYIMIESILDIDNMNKHNKILYLNYYLSNSVNDVKMGLFMLKKFKKYNVWLSSQNYTDTLNKNDKLIIEILKKKNIIQYIQPII